MLSWYRHMQCYSCIHIAERNDANFLCRYGHLRSAFDDHKLGISLSALCRCHAYVHSVDLHLSQCTPCWCATEAGLSVPEFSIL